MLEDPVEIKTLASRCCWRVFLFLLEFKTPGAIR